MKLCIIFFILSLPVALVFGQNPANGHRNLIAENAIQFQTVVEVESIESKFYQESDSLIKVCQDNFDKLDSISARFQFNFDSLKALQLTTGELTHDIDSIGQLRRKIAARLNENIQAVRDKTTGRLNALNLPPELGDKLSSLTDNVNNFRIPSMDLNLTSTNFPDSPLGKLADPSLKSSVSEIGNIGELGDIPTNVSGIPGDVSGLSADVNELTEGNLADTKALPKMAEEKAAEVSGLSDLQEQAGITDKYKSDVSRLQDPEALKEGAGERIQQAAMDHFAGKGQILQEAMETMGKYKKKYESGATSVLCQ